MFCFKFRRAVGNDNTVRFGTLIINLPSRQQRISSAHLRVEVHQRFDGGVELASARHAAGDPTACVSAGSAPGMPSRRRHRENHHRIQRLPAGPHTITRGGDSPRSLPGHNH